LFGRRLLMLTDGVRHEGQDWGIDHAPEIDPQSAAQIVVVKGAAGVRFGADAIGGVVLLEPPPMRADPGVNGELNLVAVDNGLMGLAGGRVDVVPSFLPSLSLRLEGNASKGAAASTPDYVLGNTSSETMNIAATAQWQGEVGDVPVTAKLSYRRYQASLGICYCLRVNTPSDLAAATSASKPANANNWTTSYDTERPRQDISHDLAFVRTMLDLGTVGTLTATYAFQLDLRDEFDQTRRSVRGPQLSFTLITHSVDVVFQHGPLPLGSVVMTGQWGIHGDVQQHSYQGLQLIPNFRRFVGGLYVLERLERKGTRADIELVVGARADGMVQTAYLFDTAYEAQLRRGRITADDCSVRGDVASCDKNLPALSLSVGARMHLDLGTLARAFTLQADVSMATRFPDVDELYLGGRAPSLPVFGLGDAGLGTERTVQLSVGADVHVPFLALEAGVFLSRINNYIAFGPELGADGRPIVDVLITGAFPRFSYQALEAVLSGVDGGVVLGPGELISLGLQAAMVTGTDLTHGGYLPFIPPPQVRVEVLSNLPDVEGWWLHGMVVATHVVMVGRQERTDARSDFVAPASAYVLWNADARTQLDLAGVPVTLGVEVRNILNQRYRDQLSLLRFFADQPGRELWLRAGVSFEQPFSSL
jgi:iron complex outermembrane recepter protein